MQLHCRRGVLGSTIAARQSLRGLLPRSRPHVQLACRTEAQTAERDHGFCCYSEQPRSEIVSFSSHPDAVTRRVQAASRRKERSEELEELRQLRAEWWRQQCPHNLITACSREEYITALAECKAHNGLVVVDFFSPSCYCCRMLYPKLRQIAAANLDVAFIKVNTESAEMQELAQELGVTGLPYFNLHAGAKVEAFAANLSKVGRLRNEIADLKQAVGATSDNVLQSA